MSSLNSIFQNRYLSATFLKEENSYSLYALNVLEPFPSFFFFPLLEVSAQLLAKNPQFAIVIPTDLGLSGVLLSLGYSEVRFSDKVGYTVTPDKLTHQIPFGATDYFSFASHQERFYFGLSSSEWTPQKKQQKNDPSGIETIERLTTNFDQLIEARESAVCFSENSKMSKKHINSVLKDCFYKNEKGRMRIGTAGGFQHFEIYFATAGLEDCSPGLYGICPNTREWTQIDQNSYVKYIWEASFSQEYTSECSNYFIFILNLSEMKEKYGSRSHRFSFIGLGGLLDRMHLSCTRYGLKYRTIGGFDEGLIKALLKIKEEDRIVGALAAMG